MVSSITGNATKATMRNAEPTLCFADTFPIRQAIYNTGALGGVFVPITTEVATIAAKCTG